VRVQVMHAHSFQGKAFSSGGFTIGPGNFSGSPKDIMWRSTPLYQLVITCKKTSRALHLNNRSRGKRGLAPLCAQLVGRTLGQILGPGGVAGWRVRRLTSSHWVGSGEAISLWLRRETDTSTVLVRFGSPGARLVLRSTLHPQFP